MSIEDYYVSKDSDGGYMVLRDQVDSMAGNIQITLASGFETEAEAEQLVTVLNRKPY